MRRLIASHAPWEDKVGFCRALRVGGHVFITGTAELWEENRLIDRDMLIEIEADALIEE